MERELEGWSLVVGRVMGEICLALASRRVRKAQLAWWSHALRGVADQIDKIRTIDG